MKGMAGFFSTMSAAVFLLACAAGFAVWSDTGDVVRFGITSPLLFVAAGVIELWDIGYRVQR